MVIDPALRDRFNAKWHHAETGCWLWHASVAGQYGYGQIKEPRTRRQLYAHRLSWLLHRGAIPAGLCVLHHCDTPRCVNPEHLYLGNAKHNAHDRAVRGRHLTGERMPTHKLTARDVLLIRRLCAQGVPQKQIGAAFGVHQMTVSKINRGLLWAASLEET